ncbi:MAG: universal stress protein [Chloroflexi bacterium]|nr:universal stress protein [Chloroflexota bacterium]
MSHGLLVPLDGSKVAENVVPIVAAMAGPFRFNVRFLEVVDAVEGPAGAADLQRAAASFNRYASELAEEHGLSRDQFSAATLMGDPAGRILEESRGEAMIALATHGRGGFRASVLGSVADKVVRRAEIPVLTVPGLGKPKAFGPGPVVVTLDGSPAAERALGPGRDAARLLHRDLVLLHVYSHIPPDPANMPSYPPGYLAQRAETARGWLASVALPGEALELVSGWTETALLEAIDRLDASLVVMASSGKGLAKRLTIGSTTDVLLHLLRRPMLIVPPAAES